MRPKDVYFRTHNLLTSGDGTPALKWGSTGAYREDDQGQAIYDWTILDRIFDTYLARGVRPYAQIGFMPKDLSTRPEPYQHRWKPGARYEDIYTGWAFPPKDYSKWAELVFQWTKHCVERYGRDEVETWYWQTWNEPNIGYWRGTPQEFRKLNDFALDAVRRALADREGRRPGHCRRRPLPAGLPGALRAGNQLRHRPDGHAVGFRLLSRQRSAAVRRWPRADGHRQSASRDRFVVCHHRLVSRTEAQADRHRRVRPRRLRGLLGTGLSAERLPQRNHVRQLHGGELRPQARSGREARREPRGRSHLGVRVRRSALLCRLSFAGHQRN